MICMIQADAHHPGPYQQKRQEHHQRNQDAADHIPDFLDRSAHIALSAPLSLAVILALPQNRLVTFRVVSSLTSRTYYNMRFFGLQSFFVDFAVEISGEPVSLSQSAQTEKMSLGTSPETGSQ